MYVAVRYQGDEEMFVAMTFKVVCTLSDPHLTKYWLHNTAPSLMQSTRVHSDATCTHEHLKHYVCTYMAVTGTVHQVQTCHS